MAKFGFKFMQQEEEQEEDELLEELEETILCIFCGRKTDVCLEIDTNIRLQIPICKGHAHRVRGRENLIKSLMNSIELLVAN